MAFSARVEYTGDGISNAWTVPFTYLKKTHVKLFVDGAEDTTFTWITDSSIAATTTPGDGLTVLIQRITPRSTLDTTIPASGTFRGQDLNNQAIQALYVADEAYDEISNPTSGALISGTPSANQIARFQSANTLQAGSNLTYDGSTLDVTGDGDFSGDIIVGGTVDGVDVATLKTDFDALTHDGLTGFVANEHIDWTSASVNLVTSGDLKAGRFFGNVAAPMSPGGRLTLTSNAPWIEEVTTGTAVYYTPDHHNQIPVYDGSNWYYETFSELTNTLSDATKNPAATLANTNYDMFVWNDTSGGGFRLSRGPAWTDGTTRSMGLTQINGRWTNGSAITNGPLQNRGTYVGTIRTNSSNQMQTSIRANGSSLVFGVWNMYNRRTYTLTNDFSGGSHTYGTSSIRRFAGDSGTDILLILGIGTQTCYVAPEITSDFGGGGRGSFGYGLNANTFQMTQSYGDTDGNTSISSHSGRIVMPLGFNTIRTLETAPAGTYTAFRADSRTSVVGWEA